MTLTTGGPLLPPRQVTQVTGIDDRLLAVRAEMRCRDLTVLLLVAPESVYYLSGLDYQGYFAFSALVVPRDGTPLLVTRAMEGPTVLAQVPEYVHVPYRDGEDPVSIVAGVIRAYAGPGESVGVEDAAMFFPPRLWARLRAELSELTWVDASDVVGGLRAVKSADELALVRHAAGLSDVAMAAGIGATRAGVREAHVAAAVYQAMVAAGSQPPGFAPLIRATAVLQQEHVSWSERELVAGDGLFLELSASVRRYHAPLSRTVYVGATPSGAEIAHAASIAGLHAILETLGPGVPASEVYRAWEAAVAAVRPQLGVARHHCGYLVGIGFPPSWVGGGEVLGIRPDSSLVVESGMTFHAMSWVTDPIGHVTSDTVLVTADGCERLTTAPHDLTVVS